MPARALAIKQHDGDQEHQAENQDRCDDRDHHPKASLDVVGNLRFAHVDVRSCDCVAANTLTMHRHGQGPGGDHGRVRQKTDPYCPLEPG